MAHHDEARRADGGRASGNDLAWQQDHPESSAAAVEEQALTETLVCYDAARLPLLLARDHLARRGLGDDGVAAAVGRKVRQLNFIHQRGGTLQDLVAAADQPSPLPPWAVAPTVRWREERDRRARR